MTKSRFDPNHLKMSMHLLPPRVYARSHSLPAYPEQHATATHIQTRLHRSAMNSNNIPSAALRLSTTLPWGGGGGGGSGSQPPSFTLTCASWYHHVLHAGTNKGQVVTLELDNDELLRGKMGRITNVVSGNNTQQHVQVDRVEAVERWDALLVLAGSRIQSFRVDKRDCTVLQVEPPVNMNETGVLTFAAAPHLDRLCVGLRKRALMLKRVPAINLATTARFELLSVFDVDGPARELAWVVERGGARWLSVSTDDNVQWMSAESKATFIGSSSPVDFFAEGRGQDELLFVRGSLATFARPRISTLTTTTAVNNTVDGAPRSRNNTTTDELLFAHPIVAIICCRPFFVACLQTFEYVVVLESGEPIVSFPSTRPNRGAPIRFNFCKLRRTKSHLTVEEIVTYGGTDWLVGMDLTELIQDLETQHKFDAALMILDALTSKSPTWWGAPGHDQLLVSGLRQRVCRVFSQFLISKPIVSVQDVQRAAQLLIEPLSATTTPPEAQFVELCGSILYVLRDCELFASTTEALEFIQLFWPEVTQLKKPGTVPSQRYEPGAIGAFLRDIALPVLECVREFNVISTSVDAIRVCDSLMLRALVLGRPGRNASSHVIAAFEERKRAFLLAENSCSIQESEHLLLQFPEMWEDHALLLAGKGQHRQALEYIRTLGVNYTGDDRYARASLALLTRKDFKKNDELVFDLCKWILEKHPSLGVTALVDMDFKRAIHFLRTLPSSDRLVALLLEHLVFVLKRNDLRIRDALCAVYVTMLSSRGQEEGGGEEQVEVKNKFATVVKSDGPLSLDTLLSKLDDLPEEHALVLHRAGKRHEAARVLANWNLAKAEVYAASLTYPECQPAFAALIDRAISSSQVDVALDIMGRNGTKIDFIQALRAIPDDVPVDKVAHLVESSLVRHASQHREKLVLKQLLKKENFGALRALEEERARYVVIGDDSVCAACKRGFPSDAAFVLLPGGSEIVHVGCSSSSTHSVVLPSSSPVTGGALDGLS